MQSALKQLARTVASANIFHTIISYQCAYAFHFLSLCGKFALKYFSLIKEERDRKKNMTSKSEYHIIFCRIFTPTIKN